MTQCHLIREILRMSCLHISLCDDPEVVPAGRRQMLMTKEGTDMANQTSVGQRCGRHGMAQHMRVDPLTDPSPLGITAEAFPGPMGLEPYGILPLRDEKCRMVIVPDIKVLPNPSKGRVGEVHFARLVALPDNLRHLCFPINLSTIQRQRFGNLHASNTEHFC